ncbi:MAG: carbohydrate-binding family 9-like protein [Myxococcota bacterium]
MASRVLEKRNAFRALPWLLAGTVALGAGCTEKGDEISEAERKRVEKLVSSKAPAPDHELEASFEGKVELLGYSVEPDVWKEGEKLEVTWYWKANQALEDGWLLFTHLADAQGNDRVNFDTAGAIREFYPPGKWEEGQYIQDVQEVELPADWDSPKATFHVGVWKGPHRLQVTEGPSDGDNRVRALTVRTEQATAAPQAEAEPADLPSVTAFRAEEAPTLDGKLDEALWKRTGRTDRLVNTKDGSRAEPASTVRLAWDDDHVYVAFDVADELLKSSFEEHDDHLWEEDAVEIMADPDGDGRNYFEMQVSPNGVIFDTRYDTRRQPGPFGHVDWSSELQAGVDARGKVDDGEEDEGYTVEMAIPWKAFAAGSPPASPPSVGDTWRMNFFVLDAREEGQRAVGWSPPKTNDFHVPARFGRVRFASSDGEAAEDEPEPTAAGTDDDER